MQKAFDTATETLTGAEYIHVALAGEQVVEIYNDFEGGATITSIRDFDLTAYTDEAGYVPDTEPIDGGWGSPADASAAVISENAQAAFDKATADLDKAN